jgi:hypothetical protein
VKVESRCGRQLCPRTASRRSSGDERRPNADRSAGRRSSAARGTSFGPIRRAAGVSTLCAHHYERHAEALRRSWTPYATRGRKGEPEPHARSRTREVPAPLQKRPPATTRCSRAARPTSCGFVGSVVRRGSTVRCRSEPLGRSCSGSSVRAHRPLRHCDGRQRSKVWANLGRYSYEQEFELSTPWKD